MTKSKPKTLRADWRAAFAILNCFLVAPAFAAQWDYKEAHIFVTAPATDSFAEQLLADANFHAFEPLD